MPEEADESSASEASADGTLEEWRERALELEEDVPAGRSSGTSEDPKILEYGVLALSAHNT